MVFLQNKNIDITKYKQLDPKELQIRKKLLIFYDDHTILLYIEQKSRILQKDVEAYETVFEKVRDFINRALEKKQIAINSPLCSKAKEKFEQNNWVVIV